MKRFVDLLESVSAADHDDGDIREIVEFKVRNHDVFEISESHD